MSFIGENQVPAPKLKDANLSYPDMQIAYEQCIEVNMQLYYLKTKKEEHSRNVIFMEDLLLSHWVIEQLNASG